MTKIEELYNDENSKGFVNHLIRAYLPTAKITKVWDFKSGQKHACNVCGQKLVSLAGLMQTMHEKKDEFMENFMVTIKKDLKGEKHKREDNPYVKAIGKDKVMGMTGEKTDTCLCFQCCQDLLNLVTNGMLCGDKNLIYHVKQLERDTVFSHFDKSPHLNEDEKKSVKEIKKRVDKTRVVTTFGDLGVLQDLKKKMEDKKI